MFGKKKKVPPDPPSDLKSTLQAQISALTAPQAISAFATRQSFVSSSTLRAALLNPWLEAEKPKPEPKDEPKTVVGLTGYRLYTLDNELYLCGAQGKKQKGRESEQAKHNGRSDPYGLGLSGGG